MNTIAISQINFKGYDARRLKGFLMNTNCYGIADEMKKIGDKEGFKIYTIKNDKFIEGLPKYSENTIGLWAQDLWGIAKNKLLALEYDKKFYAIKNALSLKVDFTEKICHETDAIRELNQNIWDIFDEINASHNKSGRNINEVTQDFEDKKIELLNLQKSLRMKLLFINFIKSARRLIIC